jgi:hypothetical protein
VNPIADAPVAVADAASTNEDTALVLGLAQIVTPNDTDADGDTLVISAVSNPLNGTPILNPDGSVTFTPTANFHGAAAFDYTVSDGTGRNATATVFITVTSVPDFWDWLDDHNLAAAPGDDSDGDSVSNAVEYVVGGNPANHPDTALLPTARIESVDMNGTPTDCLLFAYRRTDLAKMDSSAAISVEWTTDLSGAWTTADGTHGEVIRTEDPPGENYDWVEVGIPCSLSPHGVIFARLRIIIEQAPPP